MAVGVWLVAGHRVFEVPGQHLAGAGQRVALQRRLVTEGDHVVEALTGKLVDGLATQALGADTQVL
ncbi:hypothetical protein D3C86_2269210 [compost metagenome]